MPLEDIIFLHIPKTAGTSLRSIFFDQYRYLAPQEIYVVKSLDDLNHFWSLDEQKANDIKLVLGHCRYGVHYKFSRDFKYVTFVRSPIERSLSSYHFARWDTNNPFRTRILNENLSAVEYLCSGQFPWEENNQTKLIAGIENLSEKCTEEIYQKAIKNITESFSFIGFVEEFENDLESLAKKLSWSNQYNRQLNVTPDQAKSVPLTMNEIKCIQQANQYDQKLFNYLKMLKNSQNSLLIDG